MDLTIRITQEEANTIVQALAQMPYGMVHQLLPKLEGQFKQQLAPALPVTE